MTKKLDRLDLLLLDCLQQNNIQTADELSERVGRSPSAVARRLRKLRGSHAVTADVSLISEEAAGDPLFAVVRVQLERHLDQAAQLFRRRLVASPHVQLCLGISGAFDIFLLVVARDVDNFNLLANDLLEDEPAVRRFETSFVRKRQKATLAIPLQAFNHKAGPKT